MTSDELIIYAGSGTYRETIIIDWQVIAELIYRLLGNSIS